MSLTAFLVDKGNVLRIISFDVFAIIPDWQQY